MVVPGAWTALLKGRRGPGQAVFHAEARIVGVADVVEAMTSYRPYRAALPTEAAVAEIGYKRGVLYDEGVVDAALSLLTRKGYELGERANSAIAGVASGTRIASGS